MKATKYMYPDATPGTGGTESNKPVKTRIIPEADVDLMDLSKNVAKKWLANPDITLRYKTAAQFNQHAIDYEAELDSRKATGSLMPSQALTLKQIDKLIDKGASEVKIYIQRKFKKENALVQYARYGLVHQNKTYIISRDRNSRLAALKLMAGAIAADGFGGEEYGNAFWATMQKDYAAGIDATGTIAGNVSKKVAGKNQLKKEIKKVLSSLLQVIKGNHPDDYPSVYRDWGWQKERM